MSKVRITQIRSMIGRSHGQQRRTMRALGFGRKGKINRSVEHEFTPAIQGMISAVRHLVTVER